MIEFISKNDFVLKDQDKIRTWVEDIIASENKICGDITYIFCDDDYLDHLNQTYLNHKDFTDIISFDDTVGNIISGDIFISTERVKENADKFEVEFGVELMRVLSHGILHYCGYKDKTNEESQLMRKKEEEKIGMFHVEH